MSEPGAIGATDPTVSVESPPPEATEVAGTRPSSPEAPGEPGLLSSGTLLGPYRIVAPLGRGGMGCVYRAHDASLDREVAVKTIARALDHDAEFTRRFLAEARAAAKASHPNLVQVHYCGESAGTLFFAMELIEGESLGDRLRARGPLPWPEAVRFVVQAARGLEAAAAIGIVHRDVKPENLLLATSGVVKVADFGLAKRVTDASGPTATGIIVGTPRYVSPEQAQGEAIDSRSDVYSLGATLFHLIAGRPVFEGSSAMKVCMRHVQEPPPELAAVAAVPPALSAVVGRMLAKRKEDRPSYAQLVLELEQLLASAPATAPAPTPPPPTAPAVTPGTGGSTPRGLLSVTKRPDGGVEIGLNCHPPLDEKLLKARAEAPLAPRGRRLAAEAMDLLAMCFAFSLFKLLPWPYDPYAPAVFTAVLSIGIVHYLTRNGGSVGERLFDVRLVSRTGDLPPYPAVTGGWLLTRLVPFLAYVGVTTGVVPRENYVYLADLAMAFLLEVGLYLATGRSLRDRIFKTRVVDATAFAAQEPA